MPRTTMARSSLIAACAASWCAAADGPIDSGWRGAVAPYLLLPNIVGSAGAGRLGSVDMDVDTGTVFEQLEAGFMIRGEVGRGPWSLLLDVAYMDLGDDAEVAGGEFRADFTQVTVDGAIGYRIALRRGWIELLAGARWWDVEIDGRFDGVLLDARRDVDQDWVDPYVGLRCEVPAGERCAIVARADIGGFGAGSDLAWQAELGGSWRPAPWFQALLSYRALAVDYEDGERGEAGWFSYDIVTHGPQLGAAFLF